MPYFSELVMEMDYIWYVLKLFSHFSNIRKTIHEVNQYILILPRIAKEHTELMISTIFSHLYKHLQSLDNIVGVLNNIEWKIW